MYDDYPTIYETTLNENLIYFIILALFFLAIFIIILISLAKIFKKANRSGISAFIPFYNLIMLLEITNSSKWYFLMFLIPGVNLFFYLFTMFSLAKLFRKKKSFAFGLVFLPFIFYPILAFGDSEYMGINLVAMEGKATVTDVPKVVENEEEKNPVIHEEKDTSLKNIDISIGGGVYQKEYTSSLLQVDEKQAISNQADLEENASATNQALNQKTTTTKPSFINPVVEEEPVIEEEHSNPFIQFPDPIQVEKNNSEGNTPKIVETQPFSVLESPALSSASDHDSKNVENSWTQGTVSKQETPFAMNSEISSSTNSSSNENSEFISCPKCGAKIKRNANVCFLCGRRLDQI